MEGGIGGCSGSGIEASSPRGPRGPKESSTASSLVACAPARRGVRGPLPAGDLGVEVSDSEVFWEGFGLVSWSSQSQQVVRRVPLIDRPVLSDSVALLKFALELDLEGTSFLRG